MAITYEQDQATAILSILNFSSPYMQDIENIGKPYAMQPIDVLKSIRCDVFSCLEEGIWSIKTLDAE